MADSKYLDALSTGMRARIDPAYRLTRQRRLTEIIDVSQGGVDSLEFLNSLRPVTVRKSLDGLKVRITEF